MGNLHKVWVDLPEDISNKDDLVSCFDQFFGENWSKVMTRSGETFNYHRDWDGYIAIKDLRIYTGLMVADVKAEQVYKIILG